MISLRFATRHIFPRFGFHNSRSFSLMILNYEDMVKKGVISSDTHQLKLVKFMDKVRGLVEEYDFSSFQQQLVKEGKEDKPEMSRLRGLYLFGNVGTGKTMLMDLLYENCSIVQKRKVHFHQFMLEVHRRIHDHKQYLLRKYGRQRNINLSEEQDSIRFVAREIAKDAHLLCFDEFQVTDICDAVIMTRLFDIMWSQGVVLIATSNRPPEDLYLNGMNRPDFLPFIERLKRECIVRELDNGQDYRILRHSESFPIELSSSIKEESIYLSPFNETNSAIFFKSYEKEVNTLRSEYVSIRNTPSSRNLENKVLVAIPNSNRFLCMEQAEPAYGIALVAFSAICESDRGASDFHALATTFHTLYIANIPKLSKEKHNSARRFITLIDELYNANIRLICLAEVPPQELFVYLQPEQEDSRSSITEIVKKENPEMVKYGRNYSPARISIASTTESSASTDKDTFGTMGQQEELSIVESELASIQELHFAFRRATSRLLEMNSDHYISMWRKRYLK